MQTQPIPKRPVGRPYSNNNFGPPLKLILDELSEILSKDFSDVLDLTEARRKIRIKQIYCYVAKLITGSSLNRIGSFVNHKHDVVHYNIKKVKDLLEVKDFEFGILWLEYTSGSAIWKEYGSKIAA